MNDVTYLQNELQAVVCRLHGTDALIPGSSVYTALPSPKEVLPVKQRLRACAEPLAGPFTQLYQVCDSRALLLEGLKFVRSSARDPDPALASTGIGGTV